MCEIYLTRSFYRVEEHDESPEIVGLRIPLSWCNKRCGGFRFKYFNHQPCLGSRTCCYKRIFSVGELVEMASRFIHRCPVCFRFFVGIGSKSANNSKAVVCPDQECRRAWARRNPSPENICAVCGVPCLSFFAVSTSIMPRLHPKALFVGGNFCLCPGKCRKTFQDEAETKLKRQAIEMIRKGCSLEVKKILRERFSLNDANQGKLASAH